MDTEALRQLVACWVKENVPTNVHDVRVEVNIFMRTRPNDFVTIKIEETGGE